MAMRAPREFKLPWYLRILYSVIYIISRILLRPQLSGAENIPKSGPFIVIANHHSNFDPLILTPYFLQMPRWLGKIELFSFKPMASILEKYQVIPIDRGGINVASVKRIFRDLRCGEIIGMFPEGTRIRREQIGKKMPSKETLRLLAKSKVPILPIYLEMPYRYFCKNRVVVGPVFNYSDLSCEAGSEGLAVLEQIYNLSGKSMAELREE